MMPNTKKIRKDNRRTLPSIGSVSRRSVTRIRIPVQWSDIHYENSYIGHDMKNVISCIENEP